MDYGEFKDCVREWFRQRSTSRSSRPNTGNSYISGTMIHNIETRTVNLVVLTMMSLKKVSPNICDNDWQPEVVILPPKRVTILLFPFVGCCWTHQLVVKYYYYCYYIHPLLSVILKSRPTWVYNNFSDFCEVFWSGNNCNVVFWC